MNYWLIKSEPEEYSIDDFRKEKRTSWIGVRNYEARNNLQAMQPGDRILFYHSNAKPASVAGTAKVARRATADPEQFNPKSDYYDPKAQPEAPRWFAPELEFVEKFEDVVSLDILRKKSDLKEMTLLRKGSRLSVQPLTAKEYAVITALAKDLNQE